MVWNMTEEEWKGVLNVHLDGTFNMCRHAAGYMRNQKFGRIITMGSDAWRGTIGQANYGAAKGGIYSLTRALARELGKYGVTANTICPTAATRLTLDQRVKDGFKKRLEAGLITEARYNEVVNMPAAEYIAPLVAYLVSEDAADVNGQCFRAEGTRVSVMADPYEKAAIFKAAGAEKFNHDELADLIPRILLAEYTNPAPAATDDA
jgi:3-oxoacyl-[acyl-carrier protein] reductase